MLAELLKTNAYNSCKEEKMPHKIQPIVAVSQLVLGTKTFLLFRFRALSVFLFRSVFNCGTTSIILNPDEEKRRPSILLDIVTDGKIIFDKDDFLKSEIEALHNKLKGIGANKIKRGGKWYWILKPDIKRGEVVEV